MATGTIILTPGSAVLPDGSASNLAPGVSRRQGTQTGKKIHYLTLDFDGAGALELAMWTFGMPQDYASGGSLRISWKLAATANAVKWQAQVGAVTAADADTIDEHAFAAAATVTTNVNTTESGRENESIITLTMDSAAAGDTITIVVFRDSADAADTATQDALLVWATFEYTTT